MWKSGAYEFSYFPTLRSATGRVNGGSSLNLEKQRSSSPTPLFSLTSALPFSFSLLELCLNTISLLQLHVLSLSSLHRSAIPLLGISASYVYCVCFCSFVWNYISTFFSTDSASRRNNSSVRLSGFGFSGFCFRLPVTVHHTQSRSSL